MATYVTLYTFTDQGIRNVKDSPARLEAGIRAAEEAGMELVGAWYTQGPYDLVVVSRSDDEETATAFALGTAAQGNVRSVTLRAWEPEAFAEIVSRIP